MSTTVSPSIGALRAARALINETPCAHQCQHFSTSAPRWPRGVKGTNKSRGLSVVRAKGPIHKRVQSIKPHELPVPVMDPAKRARIETNPDHGLWGFFNRDKEAVTSPKVLGEHGRAWTKKELRVKTMDEMHIIWWKCHLQLNRLATEAKERLRLQPGYGRYELENQQQELRGTQQAIRECLQERYEAWQAAKDIVNNDQDPDLKVSDDGELVRRRTEDDFSPYEVGELDTEPKMEPMTGSVHAGR